MSEIKQSLLLTLPGGLNTRHCLEPPQSNSPILASAEKKPRAMSSLDFLDKSRGSKWEALSNHLPPAVPKHEEGLP